MSTNLNVYTQKCKYYGNITLGNPFERGGATFQGWSKSKPESMKRGNEYYEFDTGKREIVECANNYDYKLDTPGDKSFYAVWKQNDIYVFYYKKTFGLRSYSYYRTQKMKARQIFDTIEYPKDGLDFKGWNNSIKGNGLEYKQNKKYRGFEKNGYLYATYVDPRPSDISPAWKAIEDVLSGFGEGVWSASIDAVNTFLHPFKTLANIGQLFKDLLTSDGYAEIYLAIEESIVEEYNNFCQGELGDKAEVIGYLTVDIVLIVVPVSKIVKVSKASKLNKVLNKTKAVGKFNKGTSKAAIKSEMKGALKGAACFTAGTLVSTEKGLKPIEEIMAGQLVYSENPETGEKGLKKVVQTFVNKTDELIHIQVSGQNISATTEHPFYVPKKGWTKAVDLRAGDILVTVNGEYEVVEKIQHELLEESIPVYNFEVEDYHTYYVGENAVLVHNSCGLSLNKLSDSYIKKILKLDAHAIKKEYLGNSARIAQFDLAVDKNTGLIYIINKAGKVVAKTIYRTK